MTSHVFPNWCEQVPGFPHLLFMGPVKAGSWATWFNSTARFRANSDWFAYSLLHSFSPHTRMHSHTHHPDSQLNSQKNKGVRWLWLGPWAEHKWCSSPVITKAWLTKRRCINMKKTLKSKFCFHHELRSLKTKTDPVFFGYQFWYRVPNGYQCFFLFFSFKYVYLMVSNQLGSSFHV